MKLHDITIDEAKIAEFCRRNSIARMSLFGSILSDKFRPDSDIDILVELKPNSGLSLFDLGGMLMELSQLLGRDVDLRTPQELSPYFRDAVIEKSKALYAA